jgi:hypothetical protein
VHVPVEPRHTAGYTLFNDWSTATPNDVLGSDTCGNGGCLAELWGIRGECVPPPLQPGDTVALTADVLRSVRNTVVPGPSPYPCPPAADVLGTAPEQLVQGDG